MANTIDLRSHCSHFRILVIGRANAGKTTLLKKVCNSIEDPLIFDPYGDKIEASVVEESVERGLHDIENQLIFQSNPKFIFHDTRGFESGSIAETNKVKEFIAKRAGSTELHDQLHAIWYCLPTDTNRPLLHADEQFFNTDITGKVPVIAIFTMFDGLITEAFTQLKEGGVSRKEAKDRQIEQALGMLTTKFVEPLMSTKYPPADHVRLDGELAYCSEWQANHFNCNELVEKTANALSDETLKLLFVSVQQNNIKSCIYHAVLQ
ncbi:hypothetical protein GGX14DRAFT_428049 [Mycena pura]|uniref:G domain-containing protein n=1 Tax=Mycena pura TaxID=153505 RepID=A0AAD6YML6_9AGAR|nr:hypothetical protein GGX14DRAFT_428049 [Mycena pura]